MKKLLALSFAAVIISSAAFAQTERTVDSKPRMERHKGKHDKDKMMKELNLTTEQKAQMKAQHQEMKAKRDALKAQDNITVKEMREKQEALKTEQKTKMETILTSEQKTKMAEMKKQKEGERGKRKMNKTTK
jgi:periplasmic protein CpxP/Spy